MNFSCPYCGGSRLEHLRNCPKIYSVTKQKKFNIKSKKDYFGSAPNVFIGRYGYPKINVGFLSNETIPKDIDQPKLWSKEKYEIPKIVDLRSSLINSRFKTDIKSFDEKLLNITQEVSQAEKPVDIEVYLDKKPTFFSSNITRKDLPSYMVSNNQKAELMKAYRIHARIESLTEEFNM